MASLTTHAPAKLMLAGEYAVLAGAQALLACVDRYVRVTISERSGEQSELRMLGFGEQSAMFLAGDSPRWAAGTDLQLVRLADCVLRRFALTGAYTIEIDSREFYDAERKLGLGSSAAVTVALSNALAQLLKVPADIDLMLAAHREFQGGRGSGADVLAVATGGIVEVSGQQAFSLSWPADLAIGIFNLPTSASTTAHVARFQQWQDKAPTASMKIARLKQLMQDLLKRWRDGASAPIIAAFADYRDALCAIDAEADLGYLDGGHESLMKIAEQTGVMYKPAGAGGGDVGFALACDEASLDAFTSAALSAGVSRTNISPCDTRVLVGDRA